MGGCMSKQSAYIASLSQSCQMFLAKAVFDNTADTADELSFHRGDVVTVIERDIDGLEGWWLCAYKDKTGIAPGNRLRELAGMHGTADGGRADSVEKESSTPAKHKGSSWKRRSWAVSPDRVLTPQKLGNVYVYDQPAKGVHDYDVPPSRYFPAERSKTTPDRQHSQPTYDIPTAKSDNKNHVTSNTSKMFSSPATDYDVPTSHFLSANNSVNDDPVSNRSSTASIFSTGSTATASSGVSNLSPYGSSAPPSSCGSERASWDLSGQDLYDVPPPPRTITQQPKRSPSKSDLIEDYDTPKSIDKSQADYDTPRSIDYTDSPKKSLDTSTVGGCDIYDTPPSLKGKTSTHQKTDLCNLHESERTSGDSGIDTSQIDIYDFPTKASDISITEDLYSIPSNAPIVKPKLKDATNAKAFRSVGSSDSNSIYDVPPQVTRDSAISVDEPIDNRLSMCSSDSRGSDAPPVPYEELLVYRDVAMEMLVLRLQNLQKASSKILGFVSSTWRKQESLKLKLFEIKAAFQDIERTLLEFVEFGQGALANSAKAEDKKLIKKMAKQLDPLQDWLQIIKKCIDNLEAARWQITSLSSEDGKGEAGDDLNTMVATVKDIPLTSRTLASLIQGNSTLLFRKGPSPNKVGGVSSPSRPKPPLKPKPKSVSLNKDDVSTDRPLPQLPSTNRPLPPVPNAKLKPTVRDSTGSNNSAISNDYDNDYENDVNEWAHDYDYVQLTPDATVHNSSSFNFIKNSDKNSTKNNMLRGQSESETTVRDQTLNLTTPQVRTSGISDKFREKLERLQQDAKQPVEIYEDASDMAANTQKRSSQLHEYDKQILMFYAAQVDTHSTLLVNASDAFFQCVDYHQPPKVFIAHSKFVILAAHKMVYIGDTLSRNVMSQDVRGKIMTCANHLCDCLKLSVTATKNAALQYPCLQAVQDMVDCTVEVTHAADELRIVIIQAADL